MSRRIPKVKVGQLYAGTIASASSTIEGVLIQSSLLTVGDGTAASPTIKFSDNAGFYRPASSTLGIATGGEQKVVITPTTLDFYPKTSAPDSYIFTMDSTTQSTSTSTGCLVVSGGMTVVKDFYIGGNYSYGVSQSLGSLLSVRVDDGTNSAPGFRFSSDTDTGLYRYAAGTIGFTTGGTVRMRLSASALTLVAAMTVNATTASSSTATGCLVTAGGIGCAGDVSYSGATLGITGSLALNGFISADNFRFPAPLGTSDGLVLLNTRPALRATNPVVWFNSTGVYVGSPTSTTNTLCVGIGESTRCANNSVAVGASAEVMGAGGTCIGTNTRCNGSSVSAGVLCKATNAVLTTIFAGYEIQCSSPIDPSNIIAFGVFSPGTQSLSTANTVYFVRPDSTDWVYSTTDSVNWSWASDERLKTEIADFSTGLAFLANVRPVEFKWTPEYRRRDRSVHRGFTYQDTVRAYELLEDSTTFIASDYKLITSKLGDSEYGSIGREGFIPFIVNALCELEAEIKALSDV